ncbi:MAG: hypothetical protein LBF97_04600 [Elusimicrobiota bacterium]|jgi:hypothetical protein|nr:hypothetical protein [Elusimicrobiota bacterium]
MKYDWYKIINLGNFDKLNINDYEITADLEDRGMQNFRIMKGLSSLYSVILDNIFLTPFLNNRNGYNFQDRSAYIDNAKNLWVGYKADET